MRKTFVIGLSTFFLTFYAILWFFRRDNSPKIYLGHNNGHFSQLSYIGKNVSKVNLPKYNFNLLKNDLFIKQSQLDEIFENNYKESFDYHISKLDDSYDKRIKRLRHFCNKYNLTNKITTFWRKNSNQGKFGKKKYCTTKSCPLIVNEEHKLLWCFVQKVASTSLKKLFTNLLSKTDTNRGNQYKNITAFHLEANNLLYRVSPMYYNQHQLNGLFKFIFVRHPFKRIVSAFEDKGNKSRSEEPYFYAKYWDKIMKKQRGETNVNENSRPTFEEFINYLIETHPFLYDEHWAPYWTRCEPCLIKYDFIGKLETSKQDLEFLLAKCKQNKCKQNLDNRIWENKNNITKTNNKIKYYFIKLTPEKITQLYKIYFLDFKLFGYTIEEIFH